MSWEVGECGRVVSWKGKEKWEGSEVARWEWWEESEVERSEKWKGS